MSMSEWKKFSEIKPTKTGYYLVQPDIDGITRFEVLYYQANVQTFRKYKDVYAWMELPERCE